MAFPNLLASHMEFSVTNTTGVSTQRVRELVSFGAKVAGVEDEDTAPVHVIVKRKGIKPDPLGFRFSVYPYSGSWSPWMPEYLPLFQVNAVARDRTGGAPLAVIVLRMVMTRHQPSWDMSLAGIAAHEWTHHLQDVEGRIRFREKGDPYWNTDQEREARAAELRSSMTFRQLGG